MSKVGIECWTDALFFFCRLPLLRRSLGVHARDGSGEIGAAAAADAAVVCPTPAVGEGLLLLLLLASAGDGAVEDGSFSVAAAGRTDVGDNVSSPEPPSPTWTAS